MDHAPRVVQYVFYTGLVTYYDFCAMFSEQS
jgi:hypothetical protein